MYKKIKFQVIKTIIIAAAALLMTPATAWAMSLPQPNVPLEPKSKFVDVQGHWARDSITRWQDLDVIYGYGEHFFPDRNLTRAEFAALLNRIMLYPGYDGAPGWGQGFDDVPIGAWFARDIYKLNGHKIMIGNGKLMYPNDYITREEAAVIIGRAFQLPASANTPPFRDSNDFSSWSRELCTALVEQSYMQGSNSYFRPKDYITRAEVVQLLDNLVAEIYRYNYKYLQDIEGNMVINIGNITLRDATINGNLYLSASTTGTDVTLDRVTVEGDIVLMGRPNLRLANCEANNVYLQGGNNIIDGRYQYIYTTGVDPVSLTFGGTVSNMILETKTTVTNRGEIKTLDVSAPSTIYNDVETWIGHLICNAQTTVKGTNVTIDRATVRVSGCSVEVIPDRVTTSDGIVLKMPAESSSSSGGGGGGGGGSSSVTFKSGDGSQGSPYVIATASQFMLLDSSTIATNGKYFRLDANITLSKNNYITKSFQGYLDGNGHTVTVNITSATGDNVGLFSDLSRAMAGFGYICDLTVDGVISVSRNRVGGIAGTVNNGTLERCVSNVDVQGNENVGGLVGVYTGVADLPSISECYSTNFVVGTTNVGGLVGYGNAAITDCYTTSFVRGTNKVGGIVGEATAACKLVRCYSAMGVSSQNSSSFGGAAGAAVAGTFTNVMYNKLHVPSGNAYGSAIEHPMEQMGDYSGWGSKWNMPSGDLYNHATLDSGGSPVRFDGGNGSENSPYIIANAQQFMFLSLIDTEGLYFKLEKNITMKDCTYVLREFNGTFDGNSKTVTINIANTAQTDNIGLFGALGSKAHIKGLTVKGSVRATAANKGGLCGYRDPAATIENCTDNDVNVN